MKINCLHGYFKFEETKAGEASLFVDLFGLPLVRKHDYLTFADLEEAPEFSIKGKAYLSTTATETFAGHPWEVFRANGFIYDYDKGLVRPIEQITKIVTIAQAGHVWATEGLILPGSLTSNGDRVESYMGWFSGDRMRFIYSEIAYAE